MSVLHQGSFSTQWIDDGREPTQMSNPLYPMGIDIDATNGAKDFCYTPLNYPAKRCGRHIVECKICKFTVVITTAGRMDDPRSLKIPCRPLAKA